MSMLKQNGKRILSMVLAFFVKGKIMKKVISIFLSLVMLISTFCCINFSASAIEGTTYLSDEDVQFITSEFLYTLTNAEKAAYVDTLKDLNPDIEKWSDKDWETVLKVGNIIQKHWNAVNPLLPEFITKSDVVFLGEKGLTYLTSSIDYFKNIYYINETDVNNIEKAYHGVKAFQDIAKILGWSMGSFGLVLSAVSATLPLADILYSGICQESLGFYSYQLRIAYYTDAELPTPDKIMVQPAFADFINDENYINGLNALYIKYSLLRMKGNIENMTDVVETASASGIYHYCGHSYQIYNDIMDWETAKLFCENLGGHLATVTNSNEQDYVSSLVINKPTRESYWLGSYKTNSYWYWVTGETFDYSYWNEGQPDGRYESDMYLQMFATTRDGNIPGCWDDTYLKGDIGGGIKKQGLICEWDCWKNPYPTMNDEHNYVETAVEQTCTEDGYTIHKCADCGLEYYINNTTAIGHDYSVYQKTVAPTCATKGYDVYQCSRCSATQNKNYVNALGHDYQLTETVAPTCIGKGYDIYTCTRCSTTQKKNETAKTDHQYVLTSNIEPTPNDWGYSVYLCLNCGEGYSEVIPKLGGDTDTEVDTDTGTDTEISNDEEVLIDTITSVQDWTWDIHTIGTVDFTDYENVRFEMISLGGEFNKLSVGGSEPVYFGNKTSLSGKLDGTDPNVQNIDVSDKADVVFEFEGMGQIEIKFYGSRIGSSTEVEAKNGIYDGYYYENDVVVKGAGLVEIDGDYYYINARGQVFIGTITVTEAKANGLMPAGTYEFGADGKMIIPENTDTEVEAKNGIYDGYYYENDAVVKGAGLVEVDGDYYYIDSKGRVFVGTITVTAAKANGLFPAGTYEFGADGKMIIDNGPKVVNGYYYVDNVIVKGAGIVKINDDYYYIGARGQAYVGTMAVTTEKANGLVNPGTYVFGNDGKMIIDDGPRVSGGYYYENNEIVKGVGMVQVDGDLYYIGSKGQTFKGTITVTATKANDLVIPDTYEFGDDGKMVTRNNGKIANDYYYEYGELVKGSGIVEIGGYYYFINSKGKIYIGTISVTSDKTNGLVNAGTYEFGDDGRMVIDNSQKIVNSLYYVNNAVVKGAGVVEVNGNLYYIGSRGQVFKGTVSIGATKTNGLIAAGTYTFDTNGVLVQ